MTAIETNNLKILLLITVLEHSKSNVFATDQWTSFKAIRSGNLTALCAIDTPTWVIGVDDLNLPIIGAVSPPPEALCAWKCTRDSNCTGYNWKKCNNKCEFYSYVPKTCQIVSGCTHYVVNVSTGYESCLVTPVRILNLTGDDSIEQLYFNGVQMTTLPNAKEWDMIDTVVIPEDTCVIAALVKNNNPPGFGGLLASDSSGTILTNSSWKVSSWPSSWQWMTTTFDDSSWSNASVVECNSISNITSAWMLISGISKEACWIWSSSRNDYYAYFRLTIVV